MEELTTRGPVKDATGLTHAWALQSGRTTERFTGPARRTETLPGIRLSIPTQGAPAVLDLADAHEAGELYTQLEAHLENIAAPAAKGEARTAALEEVNEDGLASPVANVINQPAIMDRDVRGWTDAQCRGAWNHAMEGRNPAELTDKPTGREYTSLAAIRLRNRLNQINGADAERKTLARRGWSDSAEDHGESVTIPAAEYQRLLADAKKVQDSAKLDALFKEWVENTTEATRMKVFDLSPRLHARLNAASHLAWSPAPTAAGFVTMVPLELKEAAEAVVAAWTNEGPAPVIHRDAQDRLQHGWPALAAALDRLANASR